MRAVVLEACCLTKQEHLQSIDVFELVTPGDAGGYGSHLKGPSHSALGAPRNQPPNDREEDTSAFLGPSSERLLLNLVPGSLRRTEQCPVNGPGRIDPSQRP